MPSDRCVPFFYLAQEFIDMNPRTTAIYAYDNGRALLRLCTDAPEDAVVRKFQNDSIISRLPTKAGCSWEQLTASCTVTDRSSPSMPVPTCPQLLDTPPLPNGFLYKSTVKVDDTASCTLVSKSLSSKTCPLASTNPFTVFRTQPASLLALFWQSDSLLLLRF